MDSPLTRWYALAASGRQPPDLPDVLVWGAVVGVEEATAYAGVSAALEWVINAGRLRPASGWRRTAAEITTTFLHSRHDDTTGSTWLQWVHTERLQRFAESRSSPGHGWRGRWLTGSSTPYPYPPTPTPSWPRCAGCSTTLRRAPR